jgi:chondroitin AC lyase
MMKYKLSIRTQHHTGNLSKSLMATLFFMLATALYASDFSTIYDRMYYEYLGKNDKSTVEGVMQRMNPDGSFAKINYQSGNGSCRAHLPLLTTLASAFKNPESKFYRNADVKRCYLTALKFWIDTDPKADNWWFRYIAFPKDLSRSVILMSDEIGADKELFSKTMNYLLWAYRNADNGRMTGANGADIIMGALGAAVITENRPVMLEFRDKMTQLVSVQENEGIQPDYMFAQHCGNGRQLYLANYGKEYINSVLNYFEFCNRTQYGSSGIALLEDFFINGIQWTFFNRQYDPCQSGRYDNSDLYSDVFVKLADRMVQLNSKRQPELKTVLKRIKGDNSLTGNRMFWRFDYMINRRTAYMASTRMTSPRTVGNEAGNGDGEFNYYASNGTNYVFTTGKEYNRNYFKIFNNRQFPGITAEQDSDKLPIPNWGAGGGNGNAFAGGASDGLYGACGMILDRRNLHARKAWFYFDNEFVCLGAAIRQTGGKAPVFTTVNQCNIDDKPQYSVNGKTESLAGTLKVTDPDWILHGSTGYFNLQPGSGFVLSAGAALFSVNIDHGISPSGRSYAYAVYPGIKTPDEATAYKKSMPVTVLSNTEQLQAVRKENLKLTEIIFYEPGTLRYGTNASVTADVPCIVLINELKGEVTVANPQCESQNIAAVNITLADGGKTSKIHIDLPSGVQAGSSKTAKIN